MKEFLIRTTVLFICAIKSPLWWTARASVMNSSSVTLTGKKKIQKNSDLRHHYGMQRSSKFQHNIISSSERTEPQNFSFPGPWCVSWQRLDDKLTLSAGHLECISEHYYPTMFLRKFKRSVLLSQRDTLTSPSS